MICRTLSAGLVVAEAELCEVTKDRAKIATKVLSRTRACQVHIGAIWTLEAIHK